MGVRIGLGLAEFPFSEPNSFWRWIQLCEETGVDSIWQSDRLTGHEAYLESLVAMAAVAGATRRLKFGMNVLSIAFRDPLLVAKQCASIDFLSNGRLLPAFGLGALISPDWKAAGLSPDGQGARFDTALDLIARLWRGERVESDGPHFHYGGAQIAPLPIQQPLPLWLGGSSPAAIRRTAKYGAGWLGGVETPAAVGPIVSAIKAAAIEVGRPIDPDHFGIGFFYRLGANDDPIVEARRLAMSRAFGGRDLSAAIVAGGPEAIIAQIRAYEVAGVTKFVLRPLGGDDADILDQTRRLAEAVLPTFHHAR